MIQLTSAGKRYGPKFLFQELDWLLTPHDRVGLVGANGAGKSTLLKILAGIEEVDYGSINRAKGLSAGYLPQDGLSVSGQSVFAECLSVFSELREMEQELESLTVRMAELDHDGPEYALAAERYHTLEHEFRTRDGYALEAQVGAVLSGLGFSREDWTRRTEEFSGGWQMRIALAKLLLRKPGLLLLDEPTNHLDLEARNWLEGYLRSYPNAFVLISHDRYFLDVTVNKIVEIWNRGVHFYSGNYEKYLAQKTQRREQLLAAHRNQQERIEQLEAFINRFRYQATKAKQVQSRIKELEKIERIQIPVEEKAIHFSFPQPKASGRLVAEIQGGEKSYGSKQVLRDVNFVIERRDRIALVGVNGAGKSTLIKLLAGAEPLSAGEYRLGHNVEFDYFAQDQYKELDPEARMIDDLGTISSRATQSELRGLLGCFLFSDDDAFKRIGVLSGGERNRYALARMLMRPSNFLLLDEPTNHLDLRAKDVLLEALASFEGTVVFVSHDRYFIDKLATRVFEIAGGEVRVHPGNYEDFILHQQAGNGARAGMSSTAASASSISSAFRSSSAGSTNGGANVRLPESALAEPSAAGGKLALEDSSARRVNPIKLRKMQKRCQELEDRIARLESEIRDCEASMQQYVSPQETARLAEHLQSCRAQMEKTMSEWEEISRTLELASF